MKNRYGTATLLGLLALAAGFLMLKIGRVELPLTYLLIGVGAGAFGWGTGELLRRRAIRSDPEIEKRLRIEVQDERNQAVTNKAKARGFDAALYIYSALMLCFALMRVDLAVILLLVAAHFVTIGVVVYYTTKYNREM